MQEEKIQHLRNVSIAAVSGLPLIGGPLAVILDKYLPDFIEQRRTKMMSDIERDLSKLEDRIKPEKLNSDEFLSVFVKCFRRAMEEHNSEKINAFRAIIVNTALAKLSKYDEINFFIRLVSDLNADQILILKLLYDHDDLDEKEGIFQTIEHIWEDVDEDYLMALVTELIRMFLASSNDKQRIKAGVDYRHLLTGLGRRFIEYVKLPEEISKENNTDNI